MQDSAESLLFHLHGCLLRLLSKRAGTHFQGVSQASRLMRNRGLIKNRTANKLVKLDHAFNVLRHITEVSASDLLSSLEQEISELSVVAHECVLQPTRSPSPGSLTGCDDSSSSQPAVTEPTEPDCIHVLALDPPIDHPADRVLSQPSVSESQHPTRVCSEPPLPRDVECPALSLQPACTPDAQPETQADTGPSSPADLCDTRASDLMCYHPLTVRSVPLLSCPFNLDPRTVDGECPAQHFPLVPQTVLGTLRPPDFTDRAYLSFIRSDQLTKRTQFRLVPLGTRYYPDDPSDDHLLWPNFR